MTWNTESIFSAALRRRKRSEQKVHSKKQFPKSRRPSVRHHVATAGFTTAGRSRRYSVRKKPKPTGVCEISLEVVPKHTEKGNYSTLKASIIQYCGRITNKVMKKKISHSQEEDLGHESQYRTVAECEGMAGREHMDENRLQPTTKDIVADPDRPDQSTVQSTAVSSPCSKSFHAPDLPGVLTEDLGPAISVIPDSGILQAERVFSHTSNTGTEIEVSTEPTIPTISNDSIHPDRSSLSSMGSKLEDTKPPSVSSEDISPAISLINDSCPPDRQTLCSSTTLVTPEELINRSSVENDANFKIQSDSHGKRLLRGFSTHSYLTNRSYPERSQRSYHSCIPKRGQQCALADDGRLWQYRNTSKAPNREGCTVKPNLQQREMLRRSKNKYSLRLEANEPESAETSTQHDIEGEGRNASDSFSRKLTTEEISLHDINIEIKPSEEPSSDSSDPRGSLMQHCIQEEALPQQEEPLPPRKTIRYHVRKPGCRKVKVRVHRRPRKILVVGDMTTGKTNLISAYSRDRFTKIYTPTILHVYQTDAKICGEAIDLVVIEISGRDDFYPLRQKAYRKIDAAVICYSINSSLSLDRVCNFWVPELRRHAPKAPFVVVGTKRDLRDEARDKLEEEFSTLKKNETMEERGERDNCQRREINQELMMARLRGEASLREKFISEERGRRVAERVGADAFVECSSLYRDHTREVFETTTKIALKKTRRARTDNRSLEAACTIL